MQRYKPIEQILFKQGRMGGGENISGGKCKVNWKRVCRPKDLGGLGVMDLQQFASALRLTWLWNEWVAPEKPWVGTALPCN